MEGATFTAATTAADNIGIIAVLLLIFVFFFIWKSKDDAKKQDAERQRYQENLENMNTRLSERENMLIAQSEKREEMLKADADRREKLLREESSKRESILMANMERQTASLDGIMKTLGKMEGRMERIEQKLEKGEGNVGKRDGCRKSEDLPW